MAAGRCGADGRAAAAGRGGAAGRATGAGLAAGGGAGLAAGAGAAFAGAAGAGFLGGSCASAGAATAIADAQTISIAANLLPDLNMASSSRAVSLSTAINAHGSPILRGSWKCDRGLKFGHVAAQKKARRKIPARLNFVRCRLNQREAEPLVWLPRRRSISSVVG